ncbi:MAG TPA: DUF302 domain-containing protein [Bacteroidetes bacterium]|nr:DUF302 domain-containing protein [Bacteroidota bacterium]
MKVTSDYAIEIKTGLAFDVVIERLNEFLTEEGFGVLTEIDVKTTLKKKLNIDHKPYRILGACNPQFANRAIKAEPLIGVLLPCNIVVWDDDATRTVAAMEPDIMARIIKNPEIAAIAGEVSERIHRVIDRIGELNG